MPCELLPHVLLIEGKGAFGTVSAELRTMMAWSRCSINIC